MLVLLYIPMGFSHFIYTLIRLCILIKTEMPTEQKAFYLGISVNIRYLPTQLTVTLINTSQNAVRVCYMQFVGMLEEIQEI